MVTALGHETWLALREQAHPLDEEMLASLSPILVLSPHQDDETLGCGGLLATTSRLGLEPRVAYLTDGSASHVGSPSWPAARLSSARRLEALHALSLLGVARHQICFLGWPDARPFEPQHVCYRRSLAEISGWTAQFQPRSVWSPWLGESHCDHIAAARLAHDLAGSLPHAPVRMDFLVWGWAEPALIREARHAWKLECPGTIDIRGRALACHQTQLDGLITDATKSFQIPPALAALTKRPAEVYLQVP